MRWLEKALAQSLTFTSKFDFNECDCIICRTEKPNVLRFEVCFILLFLKHYSRICFCCKRNEKKYIGDFIFCCFFWGDFSLLNTVLVLSLSCPPKVLVLSCLLSLWSINQCIHWSFNQWVNQTNNKMLSKRACCLCKCFMTPEMFIFPHFIESVSNLYFCSTFFFPPYLPYEVWPSTHQIWISHKLARFQNIRTKVILVHIFSSSPKTPQETKPYLFFLQRLFVFGGVIDWMRGWHMCWHHICSSAVPYGRGRTEIPLQSTSAAIPYSCIGLAKQGYVTRDERRCAQQMRLKVAVCRNAFPTIIR